MYVYNGYTATDKDKPKMNTTAQRNIKNTERKSARPYIKKKQTQKISYENPEYIKGYQDAGEYLYDVFCEIYNRGMSGFNESGELQLILNEPLTEGYHDILNVQTMLITRNGVEIERVTDEFAIKQLKELENDIIKFEKDM